MDDEKKLERFAQAMGVNVALDTKDTLRHTGVLEPFKESREGKEGVEEMTKAVRALSASNLKSLLSKLETLPERSAPQSGKRDFVVNVGRKRWLNLKDYVKTNGNAILAWYKNPSETLNETVSFLIS